MPMTGQNKGIIIILDGLGDRPHADLAYKTPLEAAATPVFDSLVKRGLCGFVDPLYPWVPVGTQTGVGLLMGLARNDVHRLMRGPIEAAGVGIELAPGDVAVRCNIATLEGDARRTIIDRRAGRADEGVAELLADLDGSEIMAGVRLSVRAATRHRVVAVLKGPNLSSAVSDTDPGPGREQSGIQRCVPLDTEPSSHRTADVINRLVEESIEAFEGHPVNERRVAAGLLPVNGLITRSAGESKVVRNIVNQRGIRAAVVTGERTAVGLGRIFGFTVTMERRFDATISTNVEAKVEAVQKSLEDHDLVFVHFKGADIAAHDLDPEAKREYLERVDAAIGRLDLEPLVVGVTGDHSTDSNTGWHTGDPVPALITAPSTRYDGVKKFGERNCSKGALGRVSATSFLCACIDLMGYARQFRPEDRVLFDTD